MAPLDAIAVPMPKPLVHYWTMWNEPDLLAVRGHLDQAVSTDVVWADPQHFHTGRDALESNVKTLRMAKPQYRFVIASEIDEHNSRFRYSWHMMRKHRVLMRGLDIVSVNGDGLIERVDGFFGDPIPVRHRDSGVPAELRNQHPVNESENGV